MNQDMKFKVGEVEYSAGRLDAKRQFNIVRRLAPIIGGIAPVMGEGRSETETITAFCKVVSELPDEQLDYVIDKCLEVAERNDGGAWGKVVTATPNGQVLFMYKDIGMVEMLTIVFHVLQRSVGGFFDALPSDLVDKLKATLPGSNT